MEQKPEQKNTHKEEAKSRVEHDETDREKLRNKLKHGHI